MPEPSSAPRHELLGPQQVRVIWRTAAHRAHRLAAVARAASAVPKASASDPAPRSPKATSDDSPRFASVTRAPRRASRPTAGARDLAPRRPRRRQTTHPASLPLPGHPAALLAPTLAIRQPSRWAMLRATLLESATSLQGDFLHPRTTHGYRPAKAARAISARAPRCVSQPTAGERRMATSLPLQGTLQGTPPRFLAHCRCA